MVPKVMTSGHGLRVDIHITESILWWLYDYLSFSPDPLQGIVGTPAVWATIEEAILSPRDHIAFSGGPGNKKCLVLSTAIS